MKAVSLAVVIVLMSASAFAQTPAPALSRAAGDASLATPTGHEVNAGIGGYKYVEPGETAISIHGPKFGAGYLGTISINRSRHWFLQADGRFSIGHVTYDGWCGPFLITPDSTSPNGFALDIGDYSPCSESGDQDWYVEGRGLVGKDFIGRTWGWSPMTGLGVRHLSNGTTGVAGYRTQRYLYLPIGLTARTQLASRRALSLTVEYDRLLHGWNTTRDSALGSGDIPATSTAPAFTIDGFSDVSFDQDSGWGMRVSGKLQVTRQWSVEPSYIHWHVSPSAVSVETVGFTVNGVSAQQQFGAYEPVNHTNEFAVKFGFRF